MTDVKLGLSAVRVVEGACMLDEDEMLDRLAEELDDLTLCATLAAEFIAPIKPLSELDFIDSTLAMTKAMISPEFSAVAAKTDWARSRKHRRANVKRFRRGD